jgi:hypothetical protein
MSDVPLRKPTAPFTTARFRLLRVGRGKDKASQRWIVAGKGAREANEPKKRSSEWEDTECLADKDHLDVMVCF